MRFSKQSKINHHVSTKAGALALLFFMLGAAVFIDAVLLNFKNEVYISNTNISVTQKQSYFEHLTELVPIPLMHRPILSMPEAPSLEKMKKQGCIADGVLSGYGDEEENIELINRSECRYLHRSIETWLEPPDFDLAMEIKNSITREDIVYGMFIAEAIDKKADYYYPREDREFDFYGMCRAGTQNKWGEHTCVPSLARNEYRKYVQYITEQAIDMGVQSFMFGQVFMQEPDIGEPYMPEVIEDMREYASFRGVDIIIGAQTNDIQDPEYLRLFDYIEGGVGLHADGSIENGPCFSRWWSQPGDWCWALLWHDMFRKKANNVFVHLDWSGRVGDDMSTFARMNAAERANVLRNLHEYFTSQDVGFLVPLFAVLPENNGGCYGEKPRYYSADGQYSCADEKTINTLLRDKIFAKEY